MCDVLGAIGSFFGGGKGVSAAPVTTTTTSAGSVGDAQAAQAAQAAGAADRKRRAASSLLATGAGNTSGMGTSTSSVLASAKSSLGQ
ncbi:hypothetical protein [Burkholderia cenocepacia]|uniref:hypothetical protein n=1 Tax=Burkholderia cenocepacia TaxID=95486 RepID=UPI00163B6976|nr:hypothetical protein [Burkholderia cenocepacia]ELK7719034.1 hypothetical protein [Burkholderia cenocepacia]